MHLCHTGMLHINFKNNLSSESLDELPSTRTFGFNPLFLQNIYIKIIVFLRKAFLSLIVKLDP